VTYDDTDPAILYSAGWVADLLPQGINGTYHYTATVGDTAQFTFSGTQVTLVFDKTFLYGVLDVAIDGQPPAAVSQYDPGILYQQQWASGPLAPGAHTRLLTHAGGGTYVDLDAILVYP
jgi:hypothetical protein